MDFVTQAAILAIAFVVCVLLTFLLAAYIWDMFPQCHCFSISCPTCECETCALCVKWCRIRCCPRVFNVDLTRKLKMSIETQVKTTCEKTNEYKRRYEEAKQRLDNATVMHEPTQLIHKEVEVRHALWQENRERALELIDELPVDERDKWIHFIS